MKNQCLPLDYLKKIKNDYPGAFEMMQDFHDNRGKNGIPDWPEWCYAPIAASISIATMGDNNLNPWKLMSAMPAAQAIAALAPWRISKEIFVLDDGIEELLEEQDDDQIPSEILLQLPYPAFYVQTNHLSLGENVFDGFFVHLEYDVNNGEKELRALLLSKDLTATPIMIHIDQHDIRDNFEKIYQIAEDNVVSDPELRRELIRTKNDPASIKGLMDVHRQVLQIVLYLCSQNAEVAPNSEQAFIKRPASTTRIKDRYAEIRKWNVGTRIGSTYRKHTTSRTAASNQTGSGEQRRSPRPHMRRGHFQHFLVGKRDVPAEERKYILKWVAPTFVGQMDPDDTPAVIHTVKKDDQ